MRMRAHVEFVRNNEDEDFQGESMRLCRKESIIKSCKVMRICRKNISKEVQYFE